MGTRAEALDAGGAAAARHRPLQQDVDADGEAGPHAGRRTTRCCTARTRRAYHWAQVGTRGEPRAQRVAVLARLRGARPAEPALHHARRCLELVRGAARRSSKDWDLPCALRGARARARGRGRRRGAPLRGGSARRRRGSRTRTTAPARGRPRHDRRVGAGRRPRTVVERFLRATAGRVESTLTGGSGRGANWTADRPAEPLSLPPPETKRPSTRVLGLRASRSDSVEQLVEALGVVERADHREPQPLVARSRPARRAARPRP